MKSTYILAFALLASGQVIAGEPTRFWPVIGLRVQPNTHFEIAGGPAILASSGTLALEYNWGREHTGANLYLAYSPKGNTGDHVSEFFIRPSIRRYNLRSSLWATPSWQSTAIALETGWTMAASGSPVQAFLGIVKSSDNREHKAYFGLGVGW